MRSLRINFLLGPCIVFFGFNNHLEMIVNAMYFYCKKGFYLLTFTFIEGKLKFEIIVKAFN